MHNAEEEDHVWYGDAGLATELQRLAWDTRLEATVAIDTDLLQKIAPRLEPEAVAFVARWFTVATCSECRSLGSRGQALAAFLEAKYLAVHYDGSRDVAERQTSWPVATAIFGILDEAASESREVG